MKSLLFLTVLTICYNSRLILSQCFENADNSDDEYEVWVRRKRDSEDVTGAENPLWGNPCYYSNWTKPQLVPTTDLKLKMFAQRMMFMTIKAYRDLKNLEDRMAFAVWNKRHIEDVFKPLENYTWLQNYTTYKWTRDEVLPLEKQIYNNISREYLQTKMKKDQFQKAAPRIHKGFKVVLAALRELSEAGVCYFAINTDPRLRPDLDIAVRTVKRGLCYFTEWLEASQLENIHLDESEFFYVKKNEKIMKLWFRDALNFLDYVSQIMVYQFST